MAKSLIINRVSGRNRSIYVPTDEANAEAFAADFLDGEYQVLKLDATTGTEIETSALDVNIQVKNTTTGAKTYFNMLVSSSKTEEDIFAALMGLTIDDVVVDQAYIISMKTITF